MAEFANPVIDIHLHWCAFGCRYEGVVEELAVLAGAGYEAVVFYPLPGLGASPEKVRDLIPGPYLDLTGIDSRRTALDDLGTWREFYRHLGERNGGAPLPALHSFLDIRAWDGRTDLEPSLDMDPHPGHSGFKDILILEEDGEKMRMPPLRLVPGLSREEYLQRHRMSFGLAEELDRPLVYHADLTLHEDFVVDCLECHPDVRVDIPHFGFSRRRIAELMDRFPGVHTDVSSMASFIRKDTEGYREFIVDHPQRVLFGSDAIASYDLRGSLDHLEAVRELSLPEETEVAVLAGNARRFLAGEPA